MAKSKITFTFNSVPQIGDILRYTNSLSPSINMQETFATTRTSNGISKLGVDVYNTALNFYNAFNTDYNNTGLYTVAFTYPNIVTVEALQQNVVFTEVQNSTGGDITVDIVNESETPNVLLTNIQFTENPTNPCKKILVNVTTNVLATNVTSPVTITGNTNNPFSFEWARDSEFTLQVDNGGTPDILTGVLTPSKITSGNTSVKVYNTPSGANAIITTGTYLVNLQYSLDGITWQTSNTFTGLLEGNYTAHIKDEYGCDYFTINFAVSIFSPDIQVLNAYSYIADEMPIRFKRNQVWDYKNIYKNEHNTLSCEEILNKNGSRYKYNHLYRTTDSIVIQFLSNYGSILANVINEDGSKDSLTVVKRSNNIGAKDKRDAMYYRIDSGKTGVYYTTGNTYNYDTGVSNGSYELNGELPNYGYVGNFIYLDGLGWMQIVDIIYNENLSADVLVVEYDYSGEPDDIIVSSLYNREEYEVYEFNVNMSSYEGKNIQVEILQSDNSYGEYNYLSENIYVTDDLDDTLELLWYNPTDTSVYFSTGIQCKARIPQFVFGAGTDSEVDIHKTDNTALLINATKYKVYDLKIEAVPTAIMSQLTSALIHKELYINGVKYVSNSAPEVEKVEHTNLYNITAKLTKTGNVYKAELDGEGNSLQGVELQGLLQTDNTYITLG